ncbi:PDZ domain (Also known as DHR or GLGF) family protein [Brugia pahangi]
MTYISLICIAVDNALKLNSKFRSLLKYLESVLLPRIKQTEKLIFVGQETQEIRHLIVKPDASGERLIIAGPKDIKTKSGNRIHIGDQILALNQYLLHSVSSTGKSHTDPVHSITFTQYNDVSNECSKINSSNTKDYQLAGRQSSDDSVKKKRRKQSKSSSLNCSKFTSNKTRNKRVKQNEADERSTTALNLILTQTNDDDNADNDNNNNDDDDDDDREMLNQDAIWKFDSENVAAVLSPSFSSSTAIIDRYEKLIEIFDSDKVYGDKSNNYTQSIIIVTLLRQSPQMVLTSDWTEVEIIHLPNIPGVGLGFGIVGGTSSGVVVKTILPGSVADKDKRLCPGDHILRIRGINVHGMSPQQIATLLRRQDTLVELVVGRPALTSTNSYKNSESMIFFFFFFC